MNKKLLDILVCPFDKVTSLELFEFESASASSTSSIDNRDKTKNKDHGSETRGVITESSGSSNQDNALKTKDMATKESSIVKEGLLLCRSCLRFYPITEEIPIILPDELRDKGKDLEFLKKWQGSIPAELLDGLKPWTI